MTSDWLLVPLVVIAAVMVFVTALLLRWGAEAKSRVGAGVVLFLMMMMVSMLVGAALYFSAPGGTALVEGLWVAAALMSVSVFPLFFLILREARRSTEPGGARVDAPPPQTSWFVWSLVALVLLNELLMGYVFTLASGATFDALPGGAVGFGSLLAAIAISPWFLFTMAGEMILTTFLLRSHLPRPVLAVLLVQAVIMVFSPPALAWAGWTSLSIYVSSAVMIALFVGLMEYLYQHRQLSTVLSRYVSILLGIYALMMAGLFLWLYYGDATTFAVSIVLEMVVFFHAIVRPRAFTGDLAKPWQLRPHWAVALLSSIFVAEIFMGAVLAVQIDPAHYAGIFFTLPLTGSPATILYNAVYNGFWFLATVTASFWFLAMMGVEMGALVYFKFRETRNLENRVRMLLMMGCYAGFAVFFPSLYFNAVFPGAPPQENVPVLGWPMGIGTDVLSVSVLAVVILTYVILGVLTSLFGRRVICSTFCTASLMYQGTTVDAMKSFNRSQALPHKYLGSRFSTVYSVTTGVILGSLFLASVASYLNSTGLWNVTILGADPTAFLLAFSFGVLWYVLFVTIPYVGNYNCVTMGWCYTGAIAQAFHKVGFFKLKVRDKQVCRDCKTLDCAKGCPVGLVDMVGHFRQQGEFRSTKCCGVGDCVEACPHDNMYISDVRHWIRRRLGRPETRPRRSGVAATSVAPNVARAGLVQAMARVSSPDGFQPLPMVADSPRTNRA